MPILYSLVSRGVDALCEVTAEGVQGNFTVLSRVLLRKLPLTAGSCGSIQYDQQHTFHYLATRHGLIFLCLTDRSFPTETARCCLQAAHAAFLSQHQHEHQTAIAYSLQSSFAPTLFSLVSAYSQCPPPPPLQPDPLLVKESMLCNMDRVLQRGERLEELLVEKVSVMGDEGLKFEPRPGSEEAERRKKQHSQQRNCRIAAVMGVFVCAVTYVALTLPCGGLSLHRCLP